MSIRLCLPICLLALLLISSHSGVQAQQRVYFRSPCPPAPIPKTKIIAQRGSLPQFPQVDIPAIPDSGIPVPMPAVPPPTKKQKTNSLDIPLPTPKIPTVIDDVPPPAIPTPIPPVKPGPRKPSPLNPSPVKPATMVIPYKKPYRKNQPLRDTEVHNPMAITPGKYSVPPNHYPDTPEPPPSKFKTEITVPPPSFPPIPNSKNSVTIPPPSKKILFKSKNKALPPTTPPWNGIPKNPPVPEPVVVVPDTPIPPVPNKVVVPSIPKTVVKPSTIQPISGRPKVLPKGSSPWVVRVEVINAMTHLIARGQNTEFRVVCQNLKMQSPSGDILAEGDINIITAGFKVSCSRLIITWQDEWVTMEGNVRLYSEKEGQKLELEGTHLRLRLTTLTSAKAGNNLRSHILKTSFFRPTNRAEQPSTPRKLYQSPLRDWK